MRQAAMQPAALFQHQVGAQTELALMELARMLAEFSAA